MGLSGYVSGYVSLRYIYFLDYICLYFTHERVGAMQISQLLNV